jgi:hypothetical protein
MKMSTLYKRRRHRFRRSLSLLETIVGMSLLLVALIGTASLITSVQRTNIYSNELDMAVNSASEQIEIIKTLTVVELVAKQNDSTFTNFEVSRVVNGQIRSLTPVAGATSPGVIKIDGVAGGKMIRVTATVRWKSIVGDSQFQMLWAREVLDGPAN